ncbi:hypothetical protein LJR098_002785 [Rhizobium sp. LjRoot98]|uniref:hypothetical protein n=1 Tax=unclassified Rhizobium TaxID=2613769 RepID=UPI000714E717|nr:MULTISPECIES: hypothetical protein [unclassified Rhizobium]KQV28717.1 hypothetical protein ASC96_15160 [Rhizobium sp. Root1204]KQY05205.1 hypothetical protein ASD36_12270 [Rhizobium sp. Root1334]KRC01826.1 hypothetical protein ASE23_10045 [Rhizobium sp. Root73]
MIWIFPAVAGLLIVYFAMRSSRFRRFAEPVLSILVALALVSAFLIWINEGRTPAEAVTDPGDAQAQPALAPQDISVGDLEFTRNQPDMSYRATGTVKNNSGYNLDYFKLSVTLEDCPQNNCRTLGVDTALILARVPAGQSQSFSTFFTFPKNAYGVEPTAPKWSHQITEVRGRLP